jgi:hypothetical protein
MVRTMRQPGSSTRIGQSRGLASVLNGWEVSPLVTILAAPGAWFIEALVVLHKKTFARDR